MGRFYEDERELGKEIITFIRQYLDVPEYYELTKDYFKLTEDKDDCDSINVAINCAPILALALCRKEDSRNDIKELYFNHEQLMLSVAAKSDMVNSLGVMKYAISGDMLVYYKMALTILEVVLPQNIFTEISEDRKDNIRKTGNLYLKKPYIILLSTIDKVDTDETKEIKDSLMRIIKKYNNKLVRRTKRGEDIPLYETHDEIVDNAHKAIRSCTVAPSITKIDVAEDTMLYMFVGSELRIKNTISIDELLDLMFFNLYPLAMSELITNGYHQYCHNIHLPKDKVNGIIKDNIMLINDLAIHDTIDTPDFLLGIGNCVIEDFLVSHEQSITKEELYSMFEILCLDEDFINIDEEYRDIIISLAYYVIVMGKSYRKFCDTYNKQLNLDTVSKLNRIEQGNKVINEEMSSLKSDIATLEAKLYDKDKIYKSREDELLEQIRKLETENKRLHDIQNESSNNKKELNALREYMYKLDTEQDVNNTDYNVDKIISEIADKRITIIGGHPNWISKMKEKAPKWEYISIGVTRFSKYKISQSDVVVIVTNYCKHSMYYRVISAIENTDNVSLMYLQAGNVDKNIIDVYNNIV